MYSKATNIPRLFTIMAMAVISFVFSTAHLFSQEPITKLGDELSSRQFATRQRAMATLIQLGPSVVPELETAMSNGSRELRFRAQRVLDAVEKNYTNFNWRPSCSPVNRPLSCQVGIPSRNLAAPPVLRDAFSF